MDALDHPTVNRTHFLNAPSIIKKPLMYSSSNERRS